ncbi:hypothetical protein ACQUW0_27345, partial [Ralstonia pseudosolanacearum]|uniref:hypothetical protein n=1 Tax=Ralstonia pseudosolanacearum TaxID=1310165 RepID=UPI003D173629
YEEKGYVGVQKVSEPEGTTIDYHTNFFKFKVTGPGITGDEYACTNTEGLAVHGLDPNTGNGTYNLGDKYIFTEVLDENDYAEVYSDNTCTGEPKDISEKPMVKPVNPSVEVEVEKVGLTTEGLTVEDFANKYQGYVGVQKTIEGTPVVSSGYYFRYKVTGPGITGDKYACTNAQGIAVHGLDPNTGNGTLDKDSV